MAVATQLLQVPHVHICIYISLIYIHMVKERDPYIYIYVYLLGCLLARYLNFNFFYGLHNIGAKGLASGRGPEDSPAYTSFVMYSHRYMNNRLPLRAKVPKYGSKKGAKKKSTQI